MFDICPFHLKYKGNKTKRKGCNCHDFWVIKNLPRIELKQNEYHLDYTDIFSDGKYILSKNNEDLYRWLRFLGRDPNLTWTPSEEIK
jgi:hypothetical protein